MTYRGLRERLRDQYGCHLRGVDLSFTAIGGLFFVVERTVDGKTRQTTLQGGDGEQVPREIVEVTCDRLGIKRSEFGC